MFWIVFLKFKFSNSHSLVLKQPTVRRINLRLGSILQSEAISFDYQIQNSNKRFNICLFHHRKVKDRKYVIDRSICRMKEETAKETT